MQNPPTAMRNSFVSPQEKPTPHRDANPNGKRYRLEDGNHSNPFANTAAVSPSRTRISTRESILSRTSTFTYSRNNYSPHHNAQSIRQTLSPGVADYSRRLSSLSIDDAHGSSNRLQVLVKSLDDLESFFKDQLQSSHNAKRGDIKELNKQCKERISLLKNQINQVADEDITSEDLMKEAQARVVEVFKESENWKGQASNAQVHLRDLENKMESMAEAHRRQIKTLVDELERSKKQLERYKNQELDDLDEEPLDSSANERAREDAQKISKLELEKLRLTKSLQELQRDLQSKIDDTSEQLINTEKKLLHTESELAQAKDEAENLNNALENEMKELEACKEELSSEKATTTSLQRKLQTVEESLKQQTYVNQQLKSDFNDYKTQLEEYEFKIDDLTKQQIDTKQLEIKLQAANQHNQHLTKDNHAKADELDRAQHRISLLEKQLQESTAEVAQLQSTLSEKEGDFTGRLSQISTQNHEIASQKQQLQISLDAERAHIKQLKESLEFERAEKKRLNEELIEERSELTALQLEYQSTIKEHRDASSAAEMEVHDLKRKMDDLTKEKQQLERDLAFATSQQSDSISRVTAERDELKAKIKATNAQLAEISDVCEALQSERDQLQLTLDKERTKNQKLKSDLAQEQSNAMTLNDKISGLAEEKSNLQRRLDSASQLQSAYDGERRKNEELSKALVEQTATANDYSIEVRNVVTESKQLHWKLEASVKDKNDLQRRVHELEQELSTEQSAQSQVVSKLQEAEHEVQTLQQQCQAAINERNNLQRQLDNMMQGTRQHSESQVQLTAERNELKRKLLDVTHELDTLKASRHDREEELLQELKSKDADLHRQTNQLKKAKLRIEDLNQTLVEKTARLDRVSSDLEDARSQLQHSKMNEKSIVQTKSKLTQRLEETAANLNQVAKEAAERDIEIARLESVRADTRSRLQDALSQHAQLEQKINQLESDLQQKNSLFEELSKELAGAADYAQELESVVKSKENQLAIWKQEAQAIFDEKDEELKRLEHQENQKVEQLQTRMQTLRNKLTATEKRLEESALENSKLEEAQSELEAVLSRCERELKEARVDISRKTRDLSEMQYKFEHERELVHELTEQNAKLQEETKLMEYQESQIEERALKIEQLEDTVNKIMFDLNAAIDKKKAIEEKSKHFEEMASQIKAEAQDKIHHLESKCREAQRKIDEKERELEYIKTVLREALKENMSTETPQLDILETSKEKFVNLISELNDSQFHIFQEFVQSALDEYHGQLHHHGDGDHNEEDMETEQHDGKFQPVSDAKMMRLGRMIKDLRTRVPISAEAPGEKTTIPDTPEFKGFTEQNTVHVDGFLFSEEDVDDLVDEGKMSRNYCLDCESRKVAPLNFISHSASVLQLQFLYQVALADKVKDKVIVDVGSRLGAVLYSGHLFTRASKLIGVEINEWFTKLQQDMIKKYKMDDRVQVMCKDIQSMPELLSKEADIVIMNNVFQFFNELATQQQIWKFVRTETKKKSGLLLVTLPSLQEQLKEAGMSASKLMRGWVKEVKLDYDGGWFQDLNDDELEEIKQVHLYRVV
ncbi:conserved hypothetical protein [Mucor ambiguus]|uniref:Methyltransferase type 11 domain-containing protein n=1 Tax=Mucor ambiguus TaxID=91626 RepID=A0A0C9MLZ2_9FUNG|nr:conserved hypothetical protein [Mucor ambiguus]